MRNYLNLRAGIALGLILAFLTNIFGPLPNVEAQEFILPAPGQMVALSPTYSPAVLKGIKLDPKNPFRFHFFIDQGDGQPGDMASAVSPSRLPSKEGLKMKATQRQNPDALKQEATKLIKYFLASLTIPEKDLWVNLSPYEKDRIIPPSFGQTEMGRDLLAEDYILKQITASLIYPESRLGKEFWNKVYAQAQAKYGTTNIPINTFNKVWIVPDKAVVYENGGTAFVLENHLKVMLEEDYLALSHNVIPAKAGIHNKNDINALGSQIVRQILIPALTKEVNQGKNFAQLRQVFYSLILATWYKKKIKDSILNKIYSNQDKIQDLVIPAKVVLTDTHSCSAGIHNKNKVEYIYQQYLRAFKKGVYNYIKEEPDPLTKQTIPRKYFSGGVNAQLIDVNLAMIGPKQIGRAQISALDSAQMVEINGDMEMIPQILDLRENNKLFQTKISVDDKYIGELQTGGNGNEKRVYLKNMANSAMNTPEILDDSRADYLDSHDTDYVQAAGFYLIDSFLSYMSHEDRNKLKPHDDIGKIYLGKAKKFLSMKEPSEALHLLNRIKEVFADQHILVQRVDFLINKIKSELNKVHNNSLLDNHLLASEPFSEDVLNLILNKHIEAAIKILEENHPVGLRTNEFTKIKDYLLALLRGRDRVFRYEHETYNLEPITPELIYTFFDQVAQSKSANIAENIKQEALAAQIEVIRIPQYEFRWRRQKLNIFELGYMHSRVGKQVVERMTQELRQLVNQIVQAKNRENIGQDIDKFIDLARQESIHDIELEGEHGTHGIVFDGSYLAFKKSAEDVFREENGGGRMILMTILLDAIYVEHPLNSAIIQKIAWQLIHREAFDEKVPVDNLLNQIQKMGEFLGLDLTIQRAKLMEYPLDLSIYMDFDDNAQLAKPTDLAMMSRVIVWYNLIKELIKHDQTYKQIKDEVRQKSYEEVAEYLKNLGYNNVKPELLMMLSEFLKTQSKILASAGGAEYTIYDNIMEYIESNNIKDTLKAFTDALHFLKKQEKSIVVKYVMNKINSFLGRIEINDETIEELISLKYAIKPYTDGSERDDVKKLAKSLVGEITRSSGLYYQKKEDESKGRKSLDAAMGSIVKKKEDLGGIDLNPAQMSLQLKKEGEDFKFNFNGTQIDAAEVTGVSFTIRTMIPVTNLPLILELTQESAEKPS